VVGHDEEVQWSRELDPEAGRGGELLALGELVGVVGIEASAERPGVHRHRRVQVGVAPEDVRREAALQGFGRRDGVLSVCGGCDDGERNDGQTEREGQLPSG